MPGRRHSPARWLRNWGRVIKNVAIDVDRNHTMALAAGLSYYFVLSLFPALIALSAVVGLLSMPSLFNPLLDLLSRIVPADSMGVVRQVSSDVLTPHRGAMLSVGLIGTLWAASTGFAGMIEALDIAYDATETRPFWKTRALALVMTFLVGGLLFAAFAMVLGGPAFGAWLARTHWPWVGAIWPAVHWILSGACIVTAVECTYFLGPNVKQRLAHTLVGAIFAVVAWLGLTCVLAIYFHRFAHLNLTYGALGGVMALMIWLYWSFFVILLGAEINGETIRATQGQPLQQASEKIPGKIKEKPAADHAA